MHKTILAIAFGVLSFSQIKAQSMKAPDDIQALLQKNNCVSCHKVDKTSSLAPSWVQVAEKGYSAKKFAELVAKPVPSNWPTFNPPMAALPKTPKADLTKIANWVATLKK
jgi:cytochrome c551/c552